MTDDSIGQPAVPERPPASVPSSEPIAPRWPRPRPAEASSANPVGAGTERGASSVDPAPVAERSSSETPPAPDDEDAPSRAIDRQIRTILEWVAVAVGALAVALLIKTFLLQAFYIPSGSMETTLMRGDRVLVNKLSYDLHDVNRGDVVVFEKPPGEGGNIDDLIKRVIALPGETLTLRDGNIYIDGLLLDEPYLEPGVVSLAKTPIPNCADPASIDTCTIPEGRVFVMGDNREESRDSRFFGPISESSIVGRAFLKVWPLSDLGFL